MSDSNTPIEPGQDWTVEEWGDLSVPGDPDIALFMDYLDDDLSPEARAAFEHRMETDRAFAAKIGSLGALLVLNLPFDEDAAIRAFGIAKLRWFAAQASHAAGAEGGIDGDERVDGNGNGDANGNGAHADAWKQPPVEAGLVSVPPAGESKGKVTTVAQPGARVPGKVRAFAEPKDTMKRFVKWTMIWGAAAVVLLLALHASGQKVPLPAPQVGSEEMLSRMENAYFMGVGKEMVIGSGPLVQDTTGPNETIEVRGNGQTDLFIRPNSRFAYRTSKTALETFDYGVARATIDGEVRVQVFDKDLTVDTRHGTITLERGQYVIRSVPGGTELLVSVGSGQATISPPEAKKPVVATRGDFVRVPSIGAPTVSHDSTDFPRFVVAGDASARRVAKPTEGTHPPIPKFHKPGTVATPGTSGTSGTSSAAPAGAGGHS